MKKRMAGWKKLIVSVVAIVALILALAGFCLGPIIRSAAGPAAQAVAGVPVTIESAKVLPFSGVVRFTGVAVGAPEGFKADMMSLSRVNIEYDFRSIFSDKIRIREIAIEDPVVTYELSGIHSNVGKLLENLKASEGGDGEAGGKDADKPRKKKAKSKKTVQIDHFLFRGGKVRVGFSALDGKGVPLPLPLIELKDIGKDREGGIDTVKAIGMMAGAVVKGVLSVVGDVVAGVGGAAVDGVKAVGDAAVDGAKAVGSAAVGGVKAIGGAIGGLFGGNGDGSQAEDKAEASVEDAAKSAAKSVKDAMKGAAAGVKGAAKEAAK